MIDLDHFKRTNDTFGHEAGDLVLKEFGQLLRKMVRKEDVACRYGGEEFIVILPNAAEDIVAQRAEMLRESFSQMTFQHRHQQLGPFTLSAGCAMFPNHGQEADNVVAAADAALYKAKETRDTVVVTGQ